MVSQSPEMLQRDLEVTNRFDSEAGAKEIVGKETRVALRVLQGRR